VNYCQYTEYVYVMEEGVITEEGPFEDIKNSTKFERIYKNFYKTQAHEEEEPEESLVLAKQVSQSDKQQEALTDEVDDLMLAEDRHKGNLSSDTLLQYFKLNGGILFFVFISVITLA
jgi:ABC-type glutathione transport system ATPase component